MQLSRRVTLFLMAFTLVQSITLVIIYFSLGSGQSRADLLHPRLLKECPSENNTPKYASLLDLFGVKKLSEDDTSFVLRHLLNYLEQRGLALNHKIVTIHAGKSGAPIYELMKQPEWGGLVIEFFLPKQLEQFKTRSNLRTENVIVTSQNLIPILEKHNTPSDMDVFKIDLDSYECPLLDHLLSSGKYRPKIIFSEIMEAIPPPIRFTVGEYDINKFKGDNFLGCSAAMTTHIMEKHGYRLLTIDWNDIFFVDGEIYCSYFSGLIPRDVYELWSTGYARREDRLVYFDWHKDIDTWMDITDNLELKNTITEHMMNTKTYQTVPEASFEIAFT